MANRKPSERKNFGPQESGEPDLAPMMNLICMLIAVMIFNMQMVQIYIINTTLPSMGGPSEEQPEKKPEKPPLNLTVGVSDKGFYVSGTGLTLPGTGADGSGPTVPKKVKWTWYGFKRKCVEYETRRQGGESVSVRMSPTNTGCWVQAESFDFEDLTKKLVGIKESHPNETKLILNPSDNIRYSTIISVMDAARKMPDGEGLLFNDVVLSGGFL